MPGERKSWDDRKEWTKMRYTYRDVNDFQRRNPTRATREDALETMSVREILHIADSCATPEAKAYYAAFARQAAFDSQLRRNIAGSRKAWQNELTA